jgi:transposase
MISRQTLLRVIHRLPLPCDSTPRILGVDDFAFRKRHTYGTVLIDLERWQPVALLPDREAETLAQWLRGHPGVAVITRDRARAYASGARQGAPEATQVADRFHLLQNLTEVLEHVFHTHHTALEAVNDAIRRQGVSLPDGPMAVAVPPPLAPPTTAQKVVQRRARRVALHQQVWALHDQGWPGHAIATHLGIGKNTVFRYLRTATLPERKRRSDGGHSVLNPYKSYLLDRWNAGCCDALRLFQGLQRCGYSGSYATVARYAQRLRQAQGQAPQQRPPRQPLPIVVKPQHQLLTARRATWLALRREEKRDENEPQQLAQLRAQHAEVDEALTLVQDFVQLVRQRQPEQLDPWLGWAAKSSLVPFQRFAKGLRDDYDAVKAGVTLLWSSGPVEGQITRLKLLKRQMFGRASLALLQRRFVWVPGRMKEPAETQARPAAA